MRLTVSLRGSQPHHVSHSPHVSHSLTTCLTASLRVSQPHHVSHSPHVSHGPTCLTAPISHTTPLTCLTAPRVPHSPLSVTVSPHVSHNPASLRSPRRTLPSQSCTCLDAVLSESRSHFTRVSKSLPTCLTAPSPHTVYRCTHVSHRISECQPASPICCPHLRTVPLLSVYQSTSLALHVLGFIHRSGPLCTFQCPVDF